MLRGPLILRFLVPADPVPHSVGMRRCVWLTLVLAAGCGRPVTGDPEVPRTSTPTLVRAAETGVVDVPPLPPLVPPPPVEHGVSGLLQAIEPVLSSTPDDVETRWADLKQLESVEQQFDKLGRGALLRTSCTGLLDMREVARTTGAPFAWRDQIRDRGWARPSMAWILVEALAALREEYPWATVSIGDVAQPGCGQLAHGTLVRDVYDSPEAARATALLNEARLHYGVPTVVERTLSAAYLATEPGRYERADLPILVEHQLIGRVQGGVPGEDDAPLALRVATRRFTPLPLEEGEVDAMRDLTKRVMRSGTLVSSRKVGDWDPELGQRELWEQHWVVPATRTQLVTYSATKQRRKPRFGDIEELRFARFQHKKPGSFPNQRRWRPLRNEEGHIVGWDRWQMLYEAGHVSHVAGRDADISYVTTDNVDHFSVNLDAIDVEATWRWLELLDEKSRALGTRIDKIFVDRKIRRLLRKKLPKKIRNSRIWRHYLANAGGHDAHHHLRLQVPTHKEERAALEGLAPQPETATGN